MRSRRRRRNMAGRSSSGPFRILHLWQAWKSTVREGEECHADVAFFRKTRRPLRVQVPRDARGWIWTILQRLPDSVLSIGSHSHRHCAFHPRAAAADRCSADRFSAFEPSFMVAALRSATLASADLARRICFRAAHSRLQARRGARHISSPHCRYRGRGVGAIAMGDQLPASPCASS